MRLVWAVLVLVACGDDTAPMDAMPPTAQDFTQSGTRLRAHWVAGDGARAFARGQVRFFDAQLGVECTPILWDDGVTRCTPVTVNLELNRSTADMFGFIVWGDGACTQPIATVTPNTTCLNHYAQYGSGPGYRPIGVKTLYTMGGPANITQYWDGGPGACNGPAPLKSSERYYLTTGAIDPMMLVPLTIGDARGAGRLKWKYYESADGLVYPAVLYDDKLGADCSITLNPTTGVIVCSVARVDASLEEQLETGPSSDARVSPMLYTSATTAVYAGGLYDREAVAACNDQPLDDGTTRCVPPGARVLERMYVEQGCITPIDVVVTGFESPPPPLMITIAPGCDGVASGVYAAGPAYTFTPWEKSGGWGVCIPYARSQGDVPLKFTFYGPGPQLGYDALGPLVTRSVD